MDNEQPQHDQAILKELSDIKASLAVNTNETANIKASIGEIKADMKEIKNDFPTRRELTDGLKSVRDELESLKALPERVSALENWRWYLLGAFAALLLVVELYNRFNP